MTISSSIAKILRTNYDKLVKLNICSDKGELRRCGRSKSNEFMDLVYERLPHIDKVNGQNNVAFLIAHYFIQEGDSCKDPEMILLLYPEVKIVEAYSLQVAIPPAYQVAYSESGKCNQPVFNELNEFLDCWLSNLIGQDHGINWRDDDDSSDEDGYS